jgi:hypothetical protein
MSEQTPKVFYIGPSSFVRLYVEKVVKRDRGDVYTHAGDEDPRYLIDDLGPDVVLLDEKLSNESWAQGLLEGTQIPVVLTGANENNSKGPKPYFEKPYQDETFLSDLMKLAREAKDGA